MDKSWKILIISALFGFVPALFTSDAMRTVPTLDKLIIAFVMFSSAGMGYAVGMPTKKKTEEQLINDTISDNRNPQ